ncbi:beta-ketoacyl synthase N-terminal-like domain-containing protein [Altibacter sp. HG106]|uniref:beta-ketoacyl synthase N-terminal-like domain-containing protein n=1 Tax=Altibacter sp. HG106 TaxID=3023937 RepID=UPI00234FFF89|nr:beta-ketoacyl synthase N-terminal-like domain-containing protein [Altibacter sp. HG106]MDC7995200.1 beta-ketoacyl synthase N-terminal-like domain-containing protein [Altibacter sp. HG106]
MNLTSPSAISISGITSLSALGSRSHAIWEAYQNGSPRFSQWKHDAGSDWVSKLSTEIITTLDELRLDRHGYDTLDKSVLMAIQAARQLSLSGINQNRLGINIGSSRGATGLWEQYFQEFQQEGKVSPFTSPTTTLGNISSWVAQDLGAQGITVEHSVTCSTALHAVLNGIAWLRSGMAEGFIAGGAEAALTPFTLAQMKALRLYSKETHERPCESMRFQKKRNTMVLGEAAAVAFLEASVSKRTQALLSGWGFATEKITHGSGISEEAQCFQKSMKAALQQAQLETVDAIVMHAPGTVKGDLAEKAAIESVFGNSLPLLTSNKWLVGHTFAASGMLSLELAVMMLQHNQFIENPFYANRRHLPNKLQTVMVNAVGFGGNAVSLIVSKHNP